MKVIKRDGHMVDYCPEKIENAIQKANMEVDEEEQKLVIVDKKEKKKKAEA